MIPAQDQVCSVDARTGESRGAVADATRAAELEAMVRAAVSASAQLEAAGRAGRAALLHAIADELAVDADDIVAEADRETALGEARLRGELARSQYQFRHFADVISDGGYLDATVDTADPEAVPVPRPDIRRFLVPIGPVAVFGAGNFPLAFSVVGGDTASALAAGSAVVVKVHPGHPRTSQLSARTVRRAAERSGFASGVLDLVYGTLGGADLVRHPGIKAVGFTGSVAGGRALFDLANARPEPIPFYGELGSLNGLVVTPAAVAARGEEIARGLAGSVTLGMGQFCTKPGLVLVPAGTAGDAFVAALASALSEVTGDAMLGSRIYDGWREGVRVLDRASWIETVVGGGEQEGQLPVPALFRTTAQVVIGQGSEAVALEECFGPSTVVVTYENEDELRRIISLLPGSLTGTVHAGEAGDVVAVLAHELLAARCGRVLWNQYPTGVAVTWAMQHGGPYPASTDAAATSVGAAAIRRFLRAVAFQNVPGHVLPEELRDGNPAGIPRRVNGVPGVH